MSGEISTPPLKTETVKMHQVNCLLDDKVMQMLDRGKELLSGKYPCGTDLNVLLTELAKTWLEKNDPLIQGKRREKRKKRAGQKERSRHISAATRDAVYKRDGGRFTYVGSSGKRYDSKWDLEVHHCGAPFASGGDNATNNLKLLCRAHKHLEAERVYGEDHFGKYYRSSE